MDWVSLWSIKLQSPSMWICRCSLDNFPLILKTRSTHLVVLLNFHSDAIHPSIHYLYLLIPTRVAGTCWSLSMLLREEIHLESVAFLLWGDSANHHTTKPPPHSDVFWQYKYLRVTSLVTWSDTFLPLGVLWWECVHTILRLDCCLAASLGLS